jgi:uncharacterized RDD family membrane protein YckC
LFESWHLNARAPYDQGVQPIAGDLDLAPIPRRAFAFFLDAAILIVIVLTVGSFGVAAGASVGAAGPAMILVAAFYNIGFVAVTGATPGKTAVGLRMIDRQGLPPRPDTAILRFGVYFVFGALFPIGTIANVASMFADERRRSFADRIAGTVVIQERGQ